jgi:hypothetical protein
MAKMSIVERRGAHIRRLAIAAGVVFLTAAASHTAWAVVPVPTGFLLDISPSARILDALDMNRDGIINSTMYHDIIYDESCDNPHLRIRARNKPALMLTNESDSAAPITSFVMQINEGPYSFGTGDLVGDNFTNFIKNTMYTDAGVTITSSSVSPDMKTLTVNFDGLTAGKKAIFNIDLDTTDPNYFMYPDYRIVLFGAPLEGESPTTPADVDVTFTGPLPAPNTKTLHAAFVQEGETPEFANEHIRAYQEEDKMEVTGLGVPEPSTALLTLAGIAAFAGRFRKSSPAA